MTKFEWAGANVNLRHIMALPVGLAAVTALCFLLLLTLPVSLELRGIGVMLLYCIFYPALVIYMYYTAHPRAVAFVLTLLTSATLAWALL
ncbi:MAG: hypothetical protein AAGL66_01065 [Pseudomonadota bacterium]